MSLGIDKEEIVQTVGTSQTGSADVKFVISNQSIHNNDRFDLIADRIKGLNLTLDQFKTQLDEQREDPILASNTSRAGHSNHTVHNPSELMNQDQLRITSAISSAPGAARPRRVNMVSAPTGEASLKSVVAHTNSK